MKNLLKYFLCLGLFLNTYSVSAQTSCVVHDSVNRINRGISAQIIRNYLQNNFLPEKDNFFLSDSLIQRASQSLNAVWLDDSIQGHDTIYGTLLGSFMSGVLAKGHVLYPHYYNAIVFFDTSNVYYKNLVMGLSSGDNLYDSLVSRYDIGFEGGFIYNYESYYMTSSGFFNLTPLLDSLRLVPWIDSIYEFSEYDFIEGRGGKDFTIAFDADTTYIQYKYAFGDCTLGCHTKWYWNYKVTPECTVEFLGREQQRIPIPTVIHETKVLSCEDSIDLVEPPIPYDLDYASLSSFWDSSMNSSTGVVYSSGSYKYYRRDSNGLLVQTFIYEAEFFDKPDVKIRDTILCDGEVYTIDSLNFPYYYIRTDNNFRWNENTISMEGTYYFGIPRCYDTDTFIVEYVSIPTFQKEYAKCVYDSILVTIPEGVDSVKWDDGFIGFSRYEQNEEVFGLTVTKSVCTLKDSIVVSNYTVLPFDIGSDTIVGTGVAFEFEIDEQFKNVTWQDGDSSYYRWHRSNLLGYGTHIFTVSATDSNNCYYSDSFSIRVKNYASIEALGERTSVYPNPFSDYLYFSNARLGDRYSLYSSTGVLVRQGVVDSTQRISQLEALGSGVYYLILNSKTGVAKYKVISW
ncbi:MAG: hypothetical protein COA58_09185 [Bacteroidetes bacterium]|nr:MAG: hypothetical protein COA58_09185 [Bacteroidota bacterium]